MNSSSTTPFSFREVPKALFSWIDYALFFIMLISSVLIGIYYGFCVKKQNTKKEYLLGGKTMSAFPIAVSLIASHTSGIALLAVPADIYKFGATYWWICFAVVAVSILSCYVYLPVFIKLQLTSSYEYLKLRFDNRVRTLASFLFVISSLLYNPIVIYIPALAFSQVTGWNVHLITPIVCVSCIFYTTVGGLKAVVWTDTLQSVVMAATMAVVFYLGITSAGGFLNIWKTSLEGHRLDILNFDFDPTLRDSIWVVLIGSIASSITSFAVAPSTVQRALAVPSMKDVKKAVLIFCIGIIMVKTLSVFTGLVMFTKYSECDPLTTKQVLRTDQLLPYYVMDVAGHIPGLPGLFIAGIFSAALSTLSTTLNTVAGTIYEDFLSPFMPADISHNSVNNILKLIVVVAGIISTALVFVVENLGGILPLVVSLLGISGGPLLGLFNLGMLFPSANAKGALYGGIGGLLFMMWIVFGSQWYKLRGYLKYPAKPISIEGCDFFVNVTSSPPPLPTEEPFILYRISFWYYALIGGVVVNVLGLLISWITSDDRPPVHPDLLSPVVRPFVSNKQSSVPPPSYHSVEKALHLIKINSEELKDSKCVQADK